MAASRLSISINLYKNFNKLCILDTYAGSRNISNISILQCNSQLYLNSWRSSHSYFSRTTAEQLWKGVTSVSPAGRKKGRGKGANKRIAKDLNRGQVIGFGKKNMQWPGLNSPVIQGRELLRRQELPPDENRQKRLLEIRDKLMSRKKFKLHPLERGWSGTKLPGRSLGPPDPIGDETFEGFDSRVLQFRTVYHMTGERGRVRSLSALVVVGNKKGLAGFGLAKSTIGPSAAKAAKNRAAKVLRYIELDNTTIVHDFFSEFGATRVFAERRPKGYGLVCHRLIKAICEVLGIKDMFAKVEGSTSNYQNLTKAFFIGLMTQKSLKQVANEKGLHIVKRENERDNFPVVVASPDKCRTEKEISPTEVLDFNLHLHNGKVLEERKKYQPFYINFPSYIKEMKDREKLRNHRSIHIHLIAKYGYLASFVQMREKEKAKQQIKDAVEEQ